MRVITTITLFLCCSFLSNAQEDDRVRELIISSNKEYSASIELEIKAGEKLQQLKGSFTMNADFQYMSLSSAEFFTFNKKQIKVSNEEKKLAVYDSGMVSLGSFLFSEENAINFFFPSKVKTTTSGYEVVLLPIDNMRKTLGETTIYLDKEYKIKSVLYVLPSSNPYGIDSLKMYYTNRIETVDLTKSPNLFFEFIDDQLVINKAYTNYTILQ